MPVTVKETTSMPAMLTWVYFRSVLIIYIATQNNTSLLMHSPIQGYSIPNKFIATQGESYLCM